MIETLSQPWPWYIAGPLIGLLLPLLLFVSNKIFGISSSFRHVCAATAPANIEFLKYDWKKESWNLFFVVGIVLGGFFAAQFLPNPDAVAISPETKADLQALGISAESGLVPTELFHWSNLLTIEGFVAIVLGGFLVGFGSRYAGGCTSGHAMMGLSSMQWVSLVAVVAFFVGGLFVAHVVYPLLL